MAALTELLYVRELLIPVMLELVDHYCQHLYPQVIHTLHNTIFRLGGRRWWQRFEPA